jgi:hypothetical protein
MAGYFPASTSMAPEEASLVRKWKRAAIARGQECEKLPYVEHFEQDEFRKKVLGLKPLFYVSVTLSTLIFII